MSDKDKPEFDHRAEFEHDKAYPFGEEQFSPKLQPNTFDIMEKLEELEANHEKLMEYLEYKTNIIIGDLRKIHDQITLKNA